MRLPSIGHPPGMLRLCARIDARRPASWIALAIGAWTTSWPAWWPAASPAATQIGGGMALVSAALAAAAAVGDLPLDLIAPMGGASVRGPTFCRWRGWAGAWACERTIWPLAGLLLGAVTAGRHPALLGSLAGGLVGLPLAASTLATGRLFGATAADAASLTIVVASASAAVSVAGAARTEIFGLACGVAAWLALGGLAWAWARTSAATIATASEPPGVAVRGGGDFLSADPLPSNGPLRSILVRLAMVAALVAMAGWLGVATVDMAGWGQGGRDGRDAHAEQVGRATVVWALVSAAWFVGLAVPRATLLDGIAGGGGWERLYRTAARVRRADGGWPRWRSRDALPLGRTRFAGGVALTQAAILGWPAFLCAVLSSPAPARAALPLAIAIGLLAAAGLLVTAVAFGAACGASRDTVFAAVLAVVVVAGPGLSAFPVSPGPVVVDVAPAKWDVSDRRQRPDQRNFAGCVEKSCPEER